MLLVSLLGSLFLQVHAQDQCTDYLAACTLPTGGDGKCAYDMRQELVCVGPCSKTGDLCLDNNQQLSKCVQDSTGLGFVCPPADACTFWEDTNQNPCKECSCRNGMPGPSCQNVEDQFSCNDGGVCLQGTCTCEQANQPCTDGTGKQGMYNQACTCVVEIPPHVAACDGANARDLCSFTNPNTNTLIEGSCQSVPSGPGDTLVCVDLCAGYTQNSTTCLSCNCDRVDGISCTPASTDTICQAQSGGSTTTYVKGLCTETGSCNPCQGNPCTDQQGNAGSFDANCQCVDPCANWVDKSNDCQTCTCSAQDGIKCQTTKDPSSPCCTNADCTAGPDGTCKQGTTGLECMVNNADPCADWVDKSNDCQTCTCDSTTGEKSCTVVRDPTAPCCSLFPAACTAGPDGTCKQTNQGLACVVENPVPPQVAACDGANVRDLCTFIGAEEIPVEGSCQSGSSADNTLVCVDLCRDYTDNSTTCLSCGCDRIDGLYCTPAAIGTVCAFEDPRFQTSTPGTCGSTGSTSVCIPDCTVGDPCQNGEGMVAPDCSCYVPVCQELNAACEEDLPQGGGRFAGTCDYASPPSSQDPNPLLVCVPLCDGWVPADDEQGLCIQCTCDMMTGESKCDTATFNGNSCEIIGSNTQGTCLDGQCVASNCNAGTACDLPDNTQGVYDQNCDCKPNDNGPPPCTSDQDCDTELYAIINYNTDLTAAQRAAILACTEVYCQVSSVAGAPGECAFSDTPAVGDECIVTSSNTVGGVAGTCQQMSSDMKFCVTCNTEYQWKSLGLGDCSVTCGQGIQVEEYACVSRTSCTNGTMIMDNSLSEDVCKQQLGTMPQYNTKDCFPGECPCTDSTCPNSDDSCVEFTCDANSNSCVLSNANGMSAGSDCTVSTPTGAPTEGWTCQQSLSNNFLKCSPPPPTCPDDGVSALDCPWRDDNPCLTRSCTETNTGLQCSYDDTCTDSYYAVPGEWGNCTEPCGESFRYRSVTCYKKVKDANGNVVKVDPIPCRYVPSTVTLPHDSERCQVPPCDCGDGCLPPADSCLANNCVEGKCVIGNAEGAAVGTLCDVTTPSGETLAGTCAAVADSSVGSSAMLFCSPDVVAVVCPSRPDEFGPDCRPAGECEERTCEVNSEANALLCTYQDICERKVRFEYTLYSDCSVTCGTGIKTRGVKCFKDTYLNGQVIREEEVDCDKVANVPDDLTMDCDTQTACPQCTSDADCEGNCDRCSADGTCESTCLSPCQSCQENSAGAFACTPDIGWEYPIADDRCKVCKCNDEGGQDCRSACNTVIEVHEGEWGDCSATCGPAKKTRTVRCLETTYYPDNTTSTQTINCDPDLYPVTMDCDLPPCETKDCTPNGGECGPCGICLDDGTCGKLCLPCQTCEIDPATDPTMGACVDNCPRGDACSQFVCKEIYGADGTASADCVLENTLDYNTICVDDSPDNRCLCKDASQDSTNCALACVNTMPSSCSAPAPQPGYLFQGGSNTYNDGQGVQFVCSAGYTNGGVLGSITCEDGTWTDATGCRKVCDGSSAGDACVDGQDGVCNSLNTADPTDLTCDTGCPFLDPSPRNPCFNKECYMPDGVFDRDSRYCQRAVDAYCGSSDRVLPGCTSEDALCAVTCGGDCPECRDPDPVPDTTPPIIASVEFKFMERDCFWKADCAAGEDCIATTLWKGASEIGENDVDFSNREAGLSTIVKTCIGEYFDNFVEYKYYLSHNDVYSYSEDQGICTTSFKRGGAKGVLGDTDQHTALEALAGLERLATDQACLDLLPVEALTVTIEGKPDGNGVTCEKFPELEKQCSLDEVFAKTVACATEECTKEECCTSELPSASPALRPSMTVFLLLSSLLLVLTSRWQ